MICQAKIVLVWPENLQTHFCNLYWSESLANIFCLAKLINYLKWRGNSSVDWKFGCHAYANPLLHISIIRERANGVSIHFLYIFNLIFYLIKKFVDVFPPSLEEATGKRPNITYLCQYYVFFDALHNNDRHGTHILKQHLHFLLFSATILDTAINRSELIWDDHKKNLRLLSEALNEKLFRGVTFKKMLESGTEPETKICLRNFI